MSAKLSERTRDGTTRLICRYHDGQIQWWVERFGEGEWIHRTRFEACRILKSFKEATWCKSITDEYARQIEAAIAEYDLVHTAHGPEVSAAEGTNSLPLTEKAA